IPCRELKEGNVQKIHTAVVVVFLTSGVANAGDPLPNAPSPPSAVPRESLDAVKGALPKGWTVSVRGDAITVRPPKAVGLYNPIGMSAASRADRPPTASASYDFTLRFRPRVSVEEYERQLKEDA